LTAQWRRAIPDAMLRALALSLAQLRDPGILKVLGKSLAVTIAVFAVLGIAIWFALAAVVERFVPAGSGWEWLLTIALTVALGWVLWRIVAIAVLQFFADEVVEAVERRYYPGALAGARKLTLREELRVGLRGARRSLLLNLAALPLALALVFTGIGSPLVFWGVNAMLLGRELTELVWLRHAPTADAPPPLSQTEQMALGGISAALFLVPFVNFLAPVLAAAIATHQVNRRLEPVDAI
jgi:CysZ protein